MSLAKRETIQAVAERTRMRNLEVQRMLEALIEVWFDELARGGKIEIEHFLVLEVKTVHRNPNRPGTLITNGRRIAVPATRQELKVRASKRLRARINPRSAT